jgi:hypothetical protein
MRCAGYAWWNRGMHMGFLWESQEKREHYEELDVDTRIMLK